MKKIKNWWQDFYRDLISLKGNPQQIAKGMAFGVFIGVTPTIPFHTTLIVMLGAIFRLHITAAYIGSWLVSNPLTIPCLYFIQYRLGLFLLRMPHCEWTLKDYTIMALMRVGRDIVVPLLLGGFVMAPFVALISYFLTLHIMNKRDIKNNPNYGKER
ncbi:MAG: DUF2062 domain-containing protein [Syntrophales bacterium]|nr:DUF2062 domain-containing protein [Syntrophales bacterium]